MIGIRHSSGAQWGAHVEKNNGRWNGKYHNMEYGLWERGTKTTMYAYKISMHTWATLERWNLGEICERRETEISTNKSLSNPSYIFRSLKRGERMRIKMRKRVVDRSSGWLCRYSGVGKQTSKEFLDKLEKFQW